MDLHQYAAGVIDRVVIDDDVRRCVAQLQEVAVTAPSAVDVVEQIVANLEIVRLNARACMIVVPEDADAAACVPDDVVAEVDVPNRAPRTAAARVAHGQHDRPAGLRLHPVVLEDVLLDDHVARVLQLEQILDGPPGPPGATVPAVPAAPVSVKVACVTVQ